MMTVYESILPLLFESYKAQDHCVLGTIKNGPFLHVIAVCAAHAAAKLSRAGAQSISTVHFAAVNVQKVKTFSNLH
jgi:hypothetical protein